MQLQKKKASSLENLEDESEEELVIESKSEVEVEVENKSTLPPYEKCILKANSMHEVTSSKEFCAKLSFFSTEQCRFPAYKGDDGVDPYEAFEIKNTYLEQQLKNRMNPPDIIHTYKKHEIN